MARLILQTAEGQQAIELRPVNSLGRHPNNSIQLLDKIVSKEHCIIELRGAQFYLRDLGSLNGTFVNNERVRGEAPLKHGDEIALGSTRGRFDDTPSPIAGTAGGPPPVAPPQQQPQAWAATPQPAPVAPSPLAQSAHVLPALPTAAQANRPPQGAFAPPPMPPRPPPQAGPAAPNLPPRPQAPGLPAPNPALGIPGANPNMTMMGKGSGAHTFITGPHSYVAQGTRIDLNDQARQIGTQIAAVEKGFLPFDRLANDLNQLRADYERLRLSHELARDIASERDTSKLLDKILASIIKFIKADRGVMFLRDDNNGELMPRASQRRDGTTAPISVSSTILNHVVKERAAVLTHDAAMDFAASKGKSMILNRISSAIVVPLVAPNNTQDVLGVLWLDSETLAQFQPKDLELVVAVAHQASMFIEINILGKKIENEIIARERFSRLLSPNIAERVMSGQLEVRLGGQRVDECTVFNSDIRGFTAMSENTPPEELVDMLNEYFELMVDTIFKYEGTLDKFMGDGIMAIWGAPVIHPDDAIRSVHCALEMGEVLGDFNRRRLERDLAPLAIGIGIHTGPLVAGYIGSSKALSYTVIGDTANTSARLCSVALAGQIVVSEMTHDRLVGRFETEELPSAKVKGKEKPLRVFNVIRAATSVQVPANILAEPTISE
ncbi:adenylate/guanylate cyclase domain-containing protein [Polyangium fumosum]|uniref:FHA domain-containing protein n=1 Tax=Polyangium fumosum TaxID=889272 RepID=A0A4U1JJ15_9BACT|nr:adenylate/guanylate cyclase domain-containing protein [Polyangium fumosum]TKD12697.1 FHA domain-containing protein [Polyangium fumosum]